MVFQASFILKEIPKHRFIRRESNQRLINRICRQKQNIFSNVQPKKKIRFILSTKKLEKCAFFLEIENILVAKEKCVCNSIPQCNGRSLAFLHGVKNEENAINR